MKNVYLLLLLLFITLGSRSQTISNIKAEQAGDFIRISYQISNSLPEHSFRIAVLASINGGLNTELRSVTGDVGENVRGGKSEYWIVWDVLKDVESIESVDFIVRAELVIPAIDLAQAGSSQSLKREKRKASFVIMPLLEMPRPAVGVTIGYIGKFGVTATYVKDLEHSIPIDFINLLSSSDNAEFSRYNIGFTVRFLNRDNLKLHSLLGFGVGQVYVGDPDWKLSMSPGFEAGVILFYKKHLSVSVVSRNLLAELTEEGEIINKTNFVSAGVGLRF